MKSVNKVNSMMRMPNVSADALNIAKLQALDANSLAAAALQRALIEAAKKAAKKAVITGAKKAGKALALKTAAEVTGLDSATIGAAATAIAPAITDTTAALKTGKALSHR